MLLQVPLIDFWGDQSAPARYSGIIHSPQTLISRILPNIFSVASILLLIYLIYGGFLYINSNGDQEKVKKSQSMITNALIGFLIIFGSYWIMQAVQVITGIQFGL